MMTYRSKYYAKKTEVDGIIFDSKAEARRYRELLLLLNTGSIRDLKLQPKFLLEEGFKLKGKTYRKIEYIADFQYIEVSTGEIIVEDVKGVETEAFKLKKKLFLKKYGNIYQFRIIRR